MLLAGPATASTARDFPVSDTPGPHLIKALSGDGATTFAVWEDHSGEPRLYAGRFAGDGTRLDEDGTPLPIDIGSGFGQEPFGTAATGPAGSILAWPGGALVVGPDGAVHGPTVLPGADVAAAGNGGFVVAYSDGSTIWTAFIDADGTAAPPTVAFVIDPNMGKVHPLLASNSSGYLLVVVLDAKEAVTTTYVRRIAADGTLLDVAPVPLIGALPFTPAAVASDGDSFVLVGPEVGRSSLEPRNVVAVVPGEGLPVASFTYGYPQRRIEALTWAGTYFVVVELECWLGVCHTHLTPIDTAGALGEGEDFWIPKPVAAPSPGGVWLAPLGGTYLWLLTNIGLGG
jgi:hypothetical protein